MYYQGLLHLLYALLIKVGFYTASLYHCYWAISPLLGFR